MKNIKHFRSDIASIQFLFRSGLETSGSSPDALAELKNLVKAVPDTVYEYFNSKQSHAGVEKLHDVLAALNPGISNFKSDHPHYGFYGPRTYAAVKAIQSQFDGLTKDGRFRYDTKEALKNMNEAQGVKIQTSLELSDARASFNRSVDRQSGHLKKRVVGDENATENASNAIEDATDTLKNVTELREMLYGKVEGDKITGGIYEAMSDAIDGGLLEGGVVGFGESVFRSLFKKGSRARNKLEEAFVKEGIDKDKDDFEKVFENIIEQATQQMSVYESSYARLASSAGANLEKDEDGDFEAEVDGKGVWYQNKRQLWKDLSVALSSVFVSGVIIPITNLKTPILKRLTVLPDVDTVTSWSDHSDTYTDVIRDSFEANDQVRISSLELRRSLIRDPENSKATLEKHQGQLGSFLEELGAEIDDRGQVSFDKAKLLRRESYGGFLLHERWLGKNRGKNKEFKGLLKTVETKDTSNSEKVTALQRMLELTAEEMKDDYDFEPTAKGFRFNKVKLGIQRLKIYTNHRPISSRVWAEALDGHWVVKIKYRHPQEKYLSQREKTKKGIDRAGFITRTIDTKYEHSFFEGTDLDQLFSKNFIEDKGMESFTKDLDKQGRLAGYRELQRMTTIMDEYTQDQSELGLLHEIGKQSDGETPERNRYQNAAVGMIHSYKYFGINRDLPMPISLITPLDKYMFMQPSIEQLNTLIDNPEFKEWHEAVSGMFKGEKINRSAYTGYLNKLNEKQAESYYGDTKKRFSTGNSTEKNIAGVKLHKNNSGEVTVERSVEYANEKAFGANISHLTEINDVVDHLASAQIDGKSVTTNLLEKLWEHTGFAITRNEFLSAVEDAESISLEDIPREWLSNQGRDDDHQNFGNLKEGQVARLWKITMPGEIVHYQDEAGKTLRRTRKLTIYLKPDCSNLVLDAQGVENDITEYEHRKVDLPTEATGKEHYRVSIAAPFGGHGSERIKKDPPIIIKDPVF
jgi:hypothetical protein